MNYSKLISQIEQDARRARRAGHEALARHMEARVKVLRAEREEVFRIETTTKYPEPKPQPVRVQVRTMPECCVPMGYDETIEQALHRAEHDR